MIRERSLTCNTRDADYVIREKADDGVYQIIDAKSGLVVDEYASLVDLVEREEELSSLNGKTLKFRSEYELLWLDEEVASASRA